MRLIKLTTLFFFACLIFSCNTVQQSSSKKRNTEARDDDKKMKKALDKQAVFKNIIDADIETTPVTSKPGQDAADDPAIWINKKNPEQSIIIGTNKKAGLHLYNLKGEEIQFVRCGKVNNVDLRDGFSYKGKEVVLVAASNRSLNSISLFYLDKESGKLSDFIYNIPTSVKKAYGFCMHKDEKGNFYAIVNGKDGKVETYKIISEEEKINHKLVAKHQVNSQPEGMVADDETGTIYIGVEEEAIFSFKIDPSTHGALTKIKESDKTNPNIDFDIEGLALFNHQNQKYLVASIQGNFSYAIFDITSEKDTKYVTSFVIKKGEIDGVEETDGLEIVSYPLGEVFPKGLLVVQDGFNNDNGNKRNQNFKLISLEKIFPLLKH